MATERLCSIPDCGKPYHSRGWCKAHYARWRNHGSPTGKAPSWARPTTECVVSGCARLASRESGGRRGMCERHYREWKEARGLPRRQCSINGCDEPALTRGWCIAHYARWKRNGDPLGGKLTPGGRIEWLRSKIRHSGDECLMPDFVIKPDYWTVRIDGETRAAHRWMCEQVNGPPPAGDYEAAHSCGNGNIGCVNPNHLRWATPIENWADKVAHGRATIGEQHPAAKLTANDVREIRKSKDTLATIASQYGISVGQASSVRQRKSWACVPETAPTQT